MQDEFVATLRESSAKSNPVEWLSPVTIFKDYISEPTESLLIESINRELSHLAQKRGPGRNRIVRYGYDYSRPREWLGDLPKWVPIPDGFVCDSLTINEYLRGQRIDPHLDSTAFGDIQILSLAGDAAMCFTKEWASAEFALPRRSLAIMSGEWRTDWLHSILPLECDLRYSVIYRKRAFHD